MKLYIWNNGGSESDFAPDDNIDMGDLGRYSSNAHSGGIVVLAESLEHAKELIVTLMHEDGEYADPDIAIPHEYVPVVLELDKPGVVLYASGDC